MGAPIPLPGLQAASFRGVPFFVEAAQRVSGRRQARFELAASDITLRQDLGLLSGPIDIDGIYIGDDYIAVEAALRAAFETPGPGTLSHPWYGAIQVELASQGQTKFESHELRKFSFHATFELYQGGLSSPFSSLTNLLGAASGLLGTAGDLLSSAFTLPGAGQLFPALQVDVLTAVADSFGLSSPLFSSLPGIGEGLLGQITSLVPSSLSSLTSSAFTLLPDLTGLITNGTDAVSWVNNFATTLGAAGVPPPTPAIAPGPLGRNTASLVDTASAADFMLSLASSVAPLGFASTNTLPSTNLQEALSSPFPVSKALAPSLAVATAASILSQAVTPLTNLTYVSQQDAIAWRTKAITACEAVNIQAIALVPLQPLYAGAVMRSCRDLKSAIMNDMNSRIGRLPAIITLQAPTQVSSFIAAQYVAGDNPQRIVAMVQDIVGRNGLAHPAFCGAGTLEVLP